MKTLLGFQYFCDISSILTMILACKLLFQREKYALRDDPNPTRSNSWIKKSTFLPPPIRVLVRFSVKQVFQMLWIFDLPFKHFVFIFALFGFETHVFAPYLYFLKFFGLCFDIWIGAGQNTVSTMCIQFQLIGVYSYMLLSLVLPCVFSLCSFKKLSRSIGIMLKNKDSTFLFLSLGF